MEELLGDIYCWFEGLYGVDLADHLWGYDCNTGDYTKQNLFNFIGFISIGITFGVALIYYYVIDHPRFARWWHWLIILLLNSTICLFYGASKCLSDMNNGYISQCLMSDGDGNQLITASNCWGFGFANFIVCAVLFFIFSYIIKWGSKNCKNTPFKYYPSN